MRKRKAFKCITGLLSAAILFTSEGMSCLAFAEGTVLPPPLAISEAESGSDNPSGTEQAPAEDSEGLPASDESGGGEGASGENVIPSDGGDADSIPPDTDDGISEDDSQQDPGDPVVENPNGTNPEESDAIVSETPKSTDLPEETGREETLPESSLSENSNTLYSSTLDENVPMTDFQIVDEGGNVVDDDTIRIKRDSTRKLSVQPMPDGAVVDSDKIIWTSDNENISVENGKIFLKNTAPEGSIAGKVTVSVVISEGSADIGESAAEKTVTKSCTVEFLADMTGFEIVDQDGNSVPEEGITIVSGQQKKLGIKMIPEGSVAETTQSWKITKGGSYLRVQNGILTVCGTPSQFPYEGTLTVIVISGNNKFQKNYVVTIQSPAAGDGLRMGDIEFSCAGMGIPKQIDATTWEADIDQNNGKNAFSLTYKGTESIGGIYYNNGSAEMSVVDGNRIRNGKRYIEGRIYNLNPRYEFQAALLKNDGTFSDVYTVRFNRRSTAFTISPTSINTVPGGAAQELQVRKLPDGCELKDIIWSSGDTRIVKVKETTDNGVMLQFGQSYGQTQVIAAAKDFSGQTRYAVCNVNVSMKLPMPVFASESGSYQYDKTNSNDEYIADYWVIDKDGQVTLSLKSGTKGQIFYTTNGSDPTASGILYTSPITIKTKTTIKAYAKMAGYSDSSVTVAEFNIGNPKFTIPATASLKVTENTDQPNSKQISVTVPTGADPSFIEWSSSDGEIANGSSTETYDDNDNSICTHTISAGTKAGVCTLTASIVDYAGRTQTASCRVTVTGKLEIKPEKESLVEEETAKITITKMPRNDIPKDQVTWDISDSSVMKQESFEDGVLRVSAQHLSDISAPQTVSITASVEDGENTISAGCQITVNPKQYTVRFLGLNDKLAKEEKVFRGQSATPPDEAVMSAAAPKGYHFNGWQEPDTAWKNISADTDIHANYNLMSFNITYENLVDDNGTVLGTNPTANRNTYNVETSQSALALQDAVAAENSGKKFAGWYLEKDFSGSPIDEIPAGTTGDLILYAKWSSAKTGLRIETIAVQLYTGKAIKPMVEVYDSDTLLTLGTDYTVSYKNNTNVYAGDDPKKMPTVTVKGKGNYSGSDTETFSIAPRSVASDRTAVVIPDLYLAYTGKKLTVTPTVTWNGKKLANKKDFEVTKITKNNTEVTECIDEGEYTVTVSGKGNFTGTRDISLTVTKKTLLGKVSFKGKLKDIPWADLQGKTLGETNIQVDEEVTLKKGRDELIKGTDYTVSFDTNANTIGTYTVTFTGIGEKYAGTVSKTFKITGTPITAAKLSFGSDNKDWKPSLAYNGTPLTQSFTLYYKKDKNTLIEMKYDKDYTLAYENVTNAGNKATATITGINGYTGTVKKTFKITPYSLKDQTAATQITTSLASDSVPYEKGGAKPKVTVEYGETVLTEGKDYTVSYKNNTKLASKDDAKAPSYTVKGKGNFKDSLLEKKFSIVAQDISTLPITAEDVMAAAPNQKKGETVGKTSAGRYKSTPKITDINGKALSAGTDFLKTYTFTDENGVVLGPKDQVPAGSILTVTVEGTKNYTGKTKISYRVLAAKMSLKGASVSLKKGVTKTYDLEPVVLKKEDLVVKLNGQELSKDNYTIVSYVNNRKKGTAKVTIQGVGEYGGQKTVNFKINPRIIAWFKTP